MYVVLMVHSKFREQLLTGVLERIPYVQTIIIPYHKIEQHKNAHTHLEDLKREIQNRNLKPSDVEFVVVESNYGSPGSLGINEDTFQQLIEGYKNAQIIAASATSESLLKALKYNQCIYVVAIGNKNDMFSSEYLKYTDEIMSRVFSTSELKMLIDNAEKVNVRREEIIANQEKAILSSFDKTCSLSKSESLVLKKQEKEADEKTCGIESPSKRNLSSNSNLKS